MVVLQAILGQGSELFLEIFDAVCRALKGIEERLPMQADYLDAIINRL